MGLTVVSIFMSIPRQALIQKVFIMFQVEFREATIEDLPEIVRLLADDDLGSRREKSDGNIDPAYGEAFAAISSDPHNFVYLAVKSGKIVGCLQFTLIPNLSFTGAWRAQIEGVRIDSSQRGTGLGTEFFSWVIKQAKASKCKIIQLTMNTSRTDAHRFYESLGFEPTHTGFKLYL